MFGRSKRRESASGWEKSMFGGFKRLIKDYPEVSVDEDVKTLPDAEKMDLNHFERGKLLKMLLSKIQKHKMFDDLLEGATTERVTRQNSEGNIEQVDILTTTPEAMNKVSKDLCDKESEIAPLFEKFGDFLSNSSFQIEIPVENEEEGSPQDGDGEEGDSDGNEESEGKGNPDGGDGDESEGDSSPSDSKDGDSESEGKERKTPGKEKVPTTADHIEKAKEKLDSTKEAEKREKISGDFGKYKGEVDIVIETGIKPTAFKSNHKQDAGKLVNLLDIDWETDKDIVKNLRAGKLDLSKIAEVPCGNMSIYNREVEDMTTRPFSVCILCDESGSMSGSRIHMQHDLVKSLYLAFHEIVGPDKLFIFGHSGWDHPEIYVYHDLYNRNFEVAIDNMVNSRDMSQNYDGPAIATVHKRVREQTDDKVIFISLSDGAPSGNGYGGAEDVKDMKLIIEKCRRDDFVTVGVGIQYFAEEGLYNYSVVVEDLDRAPILVSKLVNKVVKTEFQ